MENILLSILENQSLAMWIISTLFSWLDEAQFTESNPELVAQMSRSLSLSMVNQCTASHDMTAYLVAQRRDYYLSLLPKSITPNQKKRLDLLPPSQQSFSTLKILEKITAEFKDDAATSAQVAWANAVSPPQRKRRATTTVSSHRLPKIPRLLALPSTSGLSNSPSTSSAPGASGFEPTPQTKPHRNPGGRGRGSTWRNGRFPKSFRKSRR